MAVRAVRRVRGVGCVVPQVTAAQILKAEHPLNAALVRFCGGKELSKRQAAKFLAKFPQYREAK